MQTLQSYSTVHSKIKEFYQFFPDEIEQRIRLTAERTGEETLKKETHM